MIWILRNNSSLNNNKIGVAVSGGIDSMVLLDALRRIALEKNIQIYVLHYNHKWRKKSDLDKKLVQDYCNKFSIKFIYDEADGKINKSEEEARNLRYSFFNKASKKYKLEIICTAHHRDDQIETIIFRLARGTGPKGLIPIKELNNLLCRPFIDISKDQINSYAKENHIKFINDTTNKNLKYKRNLIRLKILPLMRNINPCADNNLLVCSDLIYSQDQAISIYFAFILKKISIKSPFSWDRLRFLTLDEYTQKAFIYWFFSFYKFKGSINKIRFIIDAIKMQKRIDLHKNLSLKVDKDTAMFQVEDYKCQTKRN